MQIALFILALILFAALVVIHEFGHYFVAKRNGVKAEEFGLGLPPRAWGRRLRSGMMISLNWLPLGGFVKLKGESDSDNRPGSFGAASLSAKSQIILAGVAANLIAGLVLLTILALVGMPKLITTDSVGVEQFTVGRDTKIIHSDLLVGYIEPGSPADRIGLSPRDIIIEVRKGTDGRRVTTPIQLRTATHDFAGQSVQLKYKHRGHMLGSIVKLRDRADGANLGVSPSELQIRRSTWSAPIVAIGFSAQLFWLTLQGVGHALAGLGSILTATITGNHQARLNAQAQAGSQIGGPVAIGAILWSSGALGIYFVLMVIAIISLTLALINILPIPALDGGRLALILFSRGVLRRPLSHRTEERIVATSMALLMALLALITIVDVRRFL